MRGNRHKQKLGYSLAKWFTNFHVYFDSKFLRKINSICFAKCNKKFLKLEKYFFQNFKIIIFVKYQICMKNYLGRNLKNIFFCIFKKIFKKIWKPYMYFITFQRIFVLKHRFSLLLIIIYYASKNEKYFFTKFLKWSNFFYRILLPIQLFLNTVWENNLFFEIFNFLCYQY